MQNLLSKMFWHQFFFFFFDSARFGIKVQHLCEAEDHPQGFTISMRVYSGAGDAPTVPADAGHLKPSGKEVHVYVNILKQFVF